LATCQAATAASLLIGSSLKGVTVQADVSAALNRPFMVLFEQQRTPEPGHGVYSIFGGGSGGSEPIFAS